jgi:MscS family membrane protein
VLMVLKFAFHQDIGKVLAGLSIVGAAVALAARESIENIIASFIIFFDRPFTIGDLVKVNNITGTVEHIGLRSTRIRTPDKTFVTVPNKQMVDSIIDNLSLRTERRVEMKLEISLNATSAELKNCIDGIRKILEGKEILSSSVYLTDITGQSQVITLEYMTDNISLQDFNKIREEKAIEIKSWLEQNKIEISGANLDVRVDKNH